MTDKLKINIIGPTLGTSGYDNHTRGLANALYKLADVRLSTQLHNGWEKQVNDAELEMIGKQGKETDINIIVSMPHTWNLFLGTGKNCAYCVWEGSNVPLSYIDNMLNPKIDYILVPSQHTKDAIINTCNLPIQSEVAWFTKLIDKIKIIPHGVDFDIFKPKETKKEKFTFVCNKGWRGTNWDRGGVQYLIEAYAKEFKKEDNIKLVIKLNPAYIDQETLKRVTADLKLPEDRAEIQIILSNLPTNKLPDIYSMGNVYVCPTRAEAFDLGSAEAMAMGLSVIATNYGGQVEHMDETCSLMCDYKLDDVKEDLMYEGIQWASIDIADLQTKMRYAYEHQEEMKEKGKIAQEHISQFIWDNSAKEIIKILK